MRTKENYYTNNEQSQHHERWISLFLQMFVATVVLGFSRHSRRVEETIFPKEKTAAQVGAASAASVPS